MEDTTKQGVNKVSQIKQMNDRFEKLRKFLIRNKSKFHNEKILINVCKIASEVEWETENTEIQNHYLNTVLKGVEEVTKLNRMYFWPTLEKNNRSAPKVLARHIFYYCAYNYTKIADVVISLSNIQMFFGYQDHTTILSAKRNVDDYLAYDKKIIRIVDEVKRYVANEYSEIKLK